MHALSQVGAHSEPSRSRSDTPADAPLRRYHAEFRVPDFLVELPSWPRTFLRNLSDLLLAPVRRRPRLEITSRPAPFWPDVFVNRRMPLAPFRQSLLGHALIVVALWGLSNTWLARPRVQPQNPLNQFRVVYYPVSEYLPPLNDSSHSTPAKVERKGEPAYARQRILSLPPRPDNTSQTIVTPSPPSIPSEVALPNIVAWTPMPQPVPAAVASAVNMRLAPPSLPVPVPPPADAARAQLIAPVIASPTPVAPPPAIDLASRLPNLAAPLPVPPPPSIQANLAVPVLPPPAVIEPAPSTDRVVHIGDLNIARLDTTVAAPHLPVAGQRALAKPPVAQPAAPAPSAPAAAAVSRLASNAGALRGAAMGPGTSSVVAPPPSASSLTAMTDHNAAEQVIALGIHPVAPVGPIEVPAGNRRGTFATGPEGKPGAPGTPDVRGGAKIEDPGGRAAGAPDSATAGISVAAGPVNPGSAVVAAPSVAAMKPTKPAGIAPSANPLLAALVPPRIADLARSTRPAAGPSSPEPRVEDKIFGVKKYYSMVLNMPNLNSTGGSWVIRFAELHQNTSQARLTPPVAMVKVDPAYPTELMRGRVEGTVVLYAVIRADGSVSQVRVLNGFDKRLSASARAALMKWRFRPATSNGRAVDIEAVVQIPFQSRPSF